jgi:signal transduction histidine kinase
VLTALFRFAEPAEVVPAGRVPLITAIGCAQALLLCLRRIFPLLCLTLVVAVQVLIAAVGPSEGTLRGVAPFIAAYTVATVLRVRTAHLVAAGAAVIDTAGTLAVVPVAESGVVLTVLSHLVGSALCYVGATFVGVYVATRRSYLELLRLRADEAVRAQQAKVHAAIGAERTRMARELHDVAAHHLSGMVVYAAAVERLIDRDPRAAKDGVARIRTQGKATLDDLRLVVGVLRGPATRQDAAHPDDGRVPVPGLAMLDDLVRTARDLAVPVEFVREGQQRALPPIADVALYRVVQESLSNVRQHAPAAPVRVVLRFLPREVSIEVVNDPTPRRSEVATRTSSGVGLVGMRERAQLIGAELTAGPTAAGGWCVRVTLPTAGDDVRLPRAATTSTGTDPR